MEIRVSKCTLTYKSGRDHRAVFHKVIVGLAERRIPRVGSPSRRASLVPLRGPFPRVSAQLAPIPHV